MSQNQGKEQDTPQVVGLSALIIAQARAIESGRPDRLVDDPFAAAFVAAAGPSFAPSSPEISHLLRLRGDYIAVRTRFFDDYLMDACAAGCRQVVLLAAGLDARAFRLAWPVGTILFELDLAEVLAFKQRALAGVSAQPRCRRIMVPVDLREDWAQALLSSGFRPGEPTAWLAEGILMYLTENDRDRLLDRIGDLSATGSRLALDQRGLANAGAASEARASEDSRDAAIEAEREAGNVEAARVGVRIPGGLREPSVVDFGGWLAGHRWRVGLYNAAALFGYYGRSAEQLASEAAAEVWLASAERDQQI